jgi:hypothetical protein
MIFSPNIEGLKKYCTSTINYFQNKNKPNYRIN